MKRIGILGGAFNPITKSHIEIAKLVTNTICDEVLIMPTVNHKFKTISEFSKRCEMIELVIKDIDNVEVSQMELLNIHGTTYDLSKILQYYSGLFDHDYYFIIGTDNVNIFDNWFNYNALVEENKFIIIERELAPVLRNKSLFIDSKHKHISQTVGSRSSTDARKLIDLNSDVSHLLDDKVIEYIKSKKLYSYGKEIK